ncbi:hypothetical protein EDB85DRAFT_2147991 [Lactarius pseudohatsudake]|nr:hypothetical protein EDB85DRAFT_2147991 [Lactarius pseudohatsudake]
MPSLFGTGMPASVMFQWVFCQLEMLRHAVQPDVRVILETLPKTLDETYERVLKDINKNNRDHACRLLHCLAISVWPLHVEELAEILTFDFDTAWGGIPKSTRTGGTRGSRVVQFSHLSVKEFLTSDHLASSTGNLTPYHILPGPAHTILAQVSLGFLLHLDDHNNNNGVKGSPRPNMGPDIGSCTLSSTASPRVIPTGGPSQAICAASLPRSLTSPLPHYYSVSAFSSNDTVAPTTGDRWGWNQVQLYIIPSRGERNIPTRYLKAARWRTHRGETGYFVDFPNRPSRYYPVEFSFEHTCWCILATNDAGVRTVVRPTTHEYRCDILESEVVPLARVGPIDSVIVTSTTEEGDSGSEQSDEESEEDHLSQVNAEEQEELTNLANRAAGITLDEAPQAEHIVIHPPDEMTTTQLEPMYALQLDPIEQPRDGVPEDLLPIHPDTGHRMTADDAALMRAIGPDEPDPPEGGGPPGRGPGRGYPQGGGGGGHGGGGGPPGGGGFPGVGPTGNQPRTSDRLQGNTPMVFNGDRTKALQFRAQWNLYQGVNSTSDIMRNYYRRSLLFLSYIQGDLVNEWVMYMTDWLMRQTEARFPEHTRRLWEETLRAFTRRFSNTMEKEQAQAELRKGIHMKDGDIDSYVATFERLARQADYNLDAPQTIDLFTAGLPKGLFTKVYEQYEPATFEAWKQAAMKKQQQYLHLQARLNSIKPSTPKTTPRPSTWGPPQSGWAPRNLPHQQNPNAMDTSADRTRARGAETEGTQGRLAGAEFILGNQQRPPYPPRGGPRTRGRGRGLPRDAREVICYTCNQKGHFSRYCPQNRDTAPSSSNRKSETNYYVQEPRVKARAAMTPQQQAQEWLQGVAGASDEVKDLVLQDLWEKEGFQNA